MAGVRTARWGALLPVLLLLAVACASPAVADTTSGAGDDAGEPWRREANQDRDAELRGRLSALDNAREAEAEAAAREKSIGGEKLEEATKASKQAAAFMTKAEKLLASEDNLKDEEVRHPSPPSQAWQTAPHVQQVSRAGRSRQIARAWCVFWQPDPQLAVCSPPGLTDPAARAAEQREGAA